MSTIAIAATFTAEPVEESLAFFLRGLELPHDIEFAPYNQVFQQLLDPRSLLGANREGVNVILARLEDWAAEAEALARCVDDFLSALEAAAPRSGLPHVVITSPASDGALARPELAHAIGLLEARILERAKEISGVSAIGGADVSSAFAMGEWNDAYSDRQGRIPYTPALYAALGATIARRIFALKRPPFKVVALDCDQTIWKGVAGEDGPAGVEIDPPRAFLQEFMAAQTKQGMLAALCSKNVEEDVFRVFRERADMPLKESHLATWRINWDQKSANLRSMADELNLGLDSFVFIDDDPVVCAEVRAGCPDVLTLRLPDVAGEIPAFLKHAWAFDRHGSTEEDASRTALYRQNRDRQRLRGAVSNLREFLDSLDLRISIRHATAEQMPRVAQLTVRTNQFNFTTVRRSEAELSAWLSTNGGECLAVEVKDRFGDYGLVGAILFTTSADALTVDTLLLSCRALGRGVEHAMAAKLGALAVGRGIRFVDLDFRPTAKNQPAAAFLKQLQGDAEAAAEGSARYRFQAERLAAVTLDIASSEPKDQVTGEATAPPASRGVSAGSAGVNLFLERIAREFHNPENILKALRETKLAAAPGAAIYVAPRTGEETKLAAIWEGVLGVSPVGVDDDYFDLGGDSLTGVRMMTAIHQTFGQALTLDTLLEAPTIASLAERLRSTPVAETHLTPIQPRGSLPPLYCMHAAGGNVMFYSDLAARLGQDQPLYGLRARVSGEQPANRVEDMAARYAKDILAFQPSGPYYLAGSSFGGLVAYEVARQLRERDLTVGFLGLFDTYGPGYPQRLPGNSGLRARVNSLIDRAHHHAAALRTFDWDGRRRYVASKAAKAARLLRRSWKTRRNEIARSFYSATGQALPKELERTTNAIVEAQRRYAPLPYSGSMVLFRAAQQPRGIVPDPHLGWGGLPMGGITVFEVPGYHGAVTVEPYAGSLVEVLGPCLAQARRAAEAALTTGSGRR